MMKKLDKIPGKNPFRVPDGYFEEVNRNIIAVANGKNHNDSKAGLFHRLKPYLLAAASVAGFILLSYTAIRLLPLHQINREESEAAFEDYYSPYINDLDIYSLEENAASLAIPEQGPDVSKAEIIEYLVLENIEINDIYEQL
jgi:hypothetical protein